MLPMVMEIDLEKGFRTALSDFIIMQIQLISVFFTFQIGTKAHYYGRTCCMEVLNIKPEEFLLFMLSLLITTGCTYEVTL